MKSVAHGLAGATVVVLAVLAGPACFDATEAQNPWFRWTTLRFKAKAVPLFSGQVVMRVTEDSDGRRLDTTMTARFIGATIARTTSTTRFDPVTGMTKEYRSFSRKRGRHYIFGERSYTVEKLRPAEKNDGDWVVALRSEFPYPEADDGRSVTQLLDYYGMLLYLRRVELDAPGDEIELHVATSSGPETYRIRVSERRSQERNITDAATGEERRLTTQELRLIVTPADPDSAEGFLNMEGETEIWVEAESKTPLEIVGKVRRVPGKVRLVLREMG